MISAPRSWSSALVGSSTSSTLGSFIERPGDVDPLALTARELVRPLVALVGQAHGVEEIVGASERHRRVAGELSSRRARSSP